MKGLPFALMLLLWISPALSEESDTDIAPGPSTDFGCPLLLRDCPSGCMRDACSYLRDLCQRRTDCERILQACKDTVTECVGRWYKYGSGLVPLKKSSLARSSFLFMKLHPLLNRAVEPGLVNVPVRLRRLGERLGREFLGKRSALGDRMRGRRVPGTELLGKRSDVDSVVKRNMEMLGKRMTEMLGKRGVEFLG